MEKLSWNEVYREKQIVFMLKTQKTTAEIRSEFEEEEEEAEFTIVPFLKKMKTHKMTLNCHRTLVLKSSFSSSHR